MALLKLVKDHAFVELLATIWIRNAKAIQTFGNSAHFLGCKKRVIIVIEKKVMIKLQANEMKEVPRRHPVEHLGLLRQDATEPLQLLFRVFSFLESIIALGSKVASRL